MTDRAGSEAGPTRSMFNGAANQAARRGISLVVPLTLAGQASTPGGGPRSPAEARQADPHRSEQRLTVLLPPPSSSSSTTTATASSPCGSRDSAATQEAEPNGCWEATMHQGPCAGDTNSSSHGEGREGALVVPRATTDTVTRVIFAGIRQAQQQGQGQGQGQQQQEEGEREDRLGALERLVAAAASDPAVQASVARRVGGESGAHAAFQGLLLRPRAPPPALPASSSALLTAAGAHRPATGGSSSSSLSRLPPPLPPSPFTALPALAPPPSHYQNQHPRQQSRNFEAAVSCSVCLLPLHDAHVLDCGGGHVFCKLCVDQLLNPSASGTGGLFGVGGGVPSVARFFSILHTPLPGQPQLQEGGRDDAEEAGEDEEGGWSFFRWLGTTIFGPTRGRQRRREQERQRRRRVQFGVERRCPECRKVFTTSIPVRRINDIVDSVRTLLPNALDAEDIAEQERRAREAAAASSSHHNKARAGTTTRTRGGGSDEPLPSAGAAAGDLDLPAWVMTLVCLVVVVAMAVGRP